MNARRSRAEMAAIDPLLLSLYGPNCGCREVAQKLAATHGIAMCPATVYKRLQRLGVIDPDTPNQHRRPELVRTFPVPFRIDRRAEGMDGLIAEAKAKVWFLQHGYNVSVPVGSPPYDLIVESEEGLKKIQVKYTNGECSSSGNLQVRVSRITRSGGNVLYPRTDVDLFFIIAGTGENETYYLIPYEAVEGKHFLVLDEFWDRYKV